MAKRKTVVGVSWRRLQATPSPGAGKFRTPSGRTLRSQAQQQDLATYNSVITNVQAKVMGRMTSFRGTLDTLRKKIRLPARGHKRLTNGSPFSSSGRTPGSSQRKHERRAKRDVKMYSPFGFVTPTPERPTPSRTPAQSIRMGTRPCKRFVFSTPGKPNVENEVSELADNMKSLRSMYTPSPVCPPSDRMARSRIRTTPRTGTGSVKKQMFV